MIPRNLLQSQLALNKQHLEMLHSIEADIKAEAGVPDDFKELAKCKKQIAKYALLQRALKQEICEQINEQRFGGMFHFDRKG